MHFAGLTRNVRRIASSVALVAATAVLLDRIAWKIGGGATIEPTAWILFGVSALAILFLPRHALRAADSRPIHVVLQLLFLFTALALYSERVALLAMVPPAHWRPALDDANPEDEAG